MEKLTLICKEFEDYPFNLPSQEEVRIGRDFFLDYNNDNSYNVSDLSYIQAVSRDHFSIHQRDNHVYIKDNDSRNGTYLNDKKLVPNREYQVFQGDDLDIGPLHFVFLIRNTNLRIGEKLVKFLMRSKKSKND